MKKLSPRMSMFIFGGMALLALILLAATLNALRLDPGLPVPMSSYTPNLLNVDLPEGWQRFFLAAFRLAMIAFWVFLPIFIIYLIIDKNARKRFLRDLLLFLPILIMLLLLSRSQIQNGRMQEIDPRMFNRDDLEKGQAEIIPPLPEYQAPGEWATTITTIVLAVSITLMAVGIGFILYRRSRLAKPVPLNRIRMEAQAALDAIEAGGDLRDVILRCYAQMISALKQYRNIHRDQDMTPHEFESYLTGRGLPRDPVRHLTQLFEQVRYGGQMPGRQDERMAISSLTAIVAACERTVDAGEAR